MPTVCPMRWFLYHQSFMLMKTFMNVDVTLQGWFDEAIVHHGLSVLQPSPLMLCRVLLGAL